MLSGVNLPGDAEMLLAALKFPISSKCILKDAAQAPAGLLGRHVVVSSPRGCERSGSLLPATHRPEAADKRK